MKENPPPFLPQTALGQEGFFQRLPQSPLNVEKFLYIAVHMKNVVLPSIRTLLTRNASSANSQQLPLGREGGDCASLLGLPVITIRQTPTRLLPEGRKEKEGRKRQKQGRQKTEKQLVWH